MMYVGQVLSDQGYHELLAAVNVTNHEMEIPDAFKGKFVSLRRGLIEVDKQYHLCLVLTIETVTSAVWQCNLVRPATGAPKGM